MLYASKQATKRKYMRTVAVYLLVSKLCRIFVSESRPNDIKRKWEKRCRIQRKTSSANALTLTEKAEEIRPRNHK